jgi:galactokinase
LKKTTGMSSCLAFLITVEEVRKIIADNYEKQTGLKEDFYVCTASQGVSLC